MMHYSNSDTEIQLGNKITSGNNSQESDNMFHSLTYEVGYALEKQDFRLARVVSITLSVLLVLLYMSPIAINNGLIHLSSNATSLYLFSGLIVATLILAIWQMILLTKYLRNFYHPLANIFTDIKGVAVTVIILAMLIFVSVTVHMSMLMQNGIMSFFIAFYVLWAFMQIMAGWILIDSKEVDFVGGLSSLGYALLISGIIPLLIIFVPLVVSSVFINASKYSKKYGFL